MSYKNFEIWQLSKEIVILVHKMTMKLPQFELYETGSQIRRYSKSIRSNIVEGYGRRRYKKDYTRFLIYAHSSVDDTRGHLEILYEPKSLRDKDIFAQIAPRLALIGKSYGLCNQSKRITKVNFD
jgi:four helix bundle protein